MRPGASPSERFDAWFVKAVDKLKELPEGDGAFAALMIALPLYERSIIARLKLDRKAAGEEDVARAMGADLQLNDVDRRIFWATFRTGFMHQGMAQAGRTQWVVSHEFGALPEFRTLAGSRCICFDPWKFVDRVLNTFKHDPRLIMASESFPLAAVFALNPDSLL